MVKPSPSLASELAKLVDAEDGFAEVYDPVTKRMFVVSERTEPHPRAHPETDEELRRQLDEARKDIEEGRICTLTTEEILIEARRRAGLL